MKKLLCILLVCVLMLSMTVVSVGAEGNIRGWFYIEYLKQHSEATYYSEKYYHYENPDDFDSSNIDWALVFCTQYVMDDFVDNTYFYLVGDRVVVATADYSPYEIPYAVYDKGKNEFINITDVNPDDYPGLLEALDNEIFVHRIGDMDRDKCISVIDATIIQQAVAGVVEYPDFDENKSWCVNGSETFYFYSDYDRDGERTVMDATAIQKKLVQG